MRSTGRIIVTVLAALAAAVKWQARGNSQRVQTTTVWDASVDEWTPPVGSTSADYHDFFVAWSGGSPLPPGWTKVDHRGSVHAYTTGLVDDATGEIQVMITASDDSSDMHSAEVFVDDVSQGTFDRSSGAMRDRSGHAILNVPILVEPRLPGEWLGIRLEWTSDAGSVNSHEALLRF